MDFAFHHCRRPESNRYGYRYPRDFKSRASASSATAAKWDLQGSNLWPSACKADALPAELRSQVILFSSFLSHKKWRPRWDSNPRPPPWQGGALTNWATGPKYLKWTFGDSNPGPTGYEPVALTNWAKGPNTLLGSTFKKADDRTRTDNLLITNQLLCQLSHIGT